MLMKRFLVFALFAIGVTTSATAQVEIPRTDSVEGTEVYLISPQDGDVIEGPVTIRFGVKGMGIAPAGIPFPETGHHHLLINVTDLPPMNMPVPTDDNHRHFGKGQTEVTLDLPAGTHTLQLLFADHNHIPHEPPVISDKITITVR